MKEFKLTKEQERINSKNNSRAKKYFESIYPWYKNRKRNQYHLHHKDENLRWTDVDRYIEWRIEDLEVITSKEHKRLHMCGEKNPTKRPEVKEKISAAHKGKPGHTHTEESKKKMSESRKGIIITAEWRRKIGDGNRGKVMSEESKKKISQNCGSKRPEVKEKISIANTGNHRYNNGVINTWAKECPDGFVPGWIVNKGK